jgi:hypothetical protein
MRRCRVGVGIVYLGFDPGKKGSAAAVTASGEWAGSVRFDRDTPGDIVEWLKNLACDNQISAAFIEQVSSSPQMGVKSAFTFGQGYGWCRGILDALGIPYEMVTPSKWQRKMKCLSGGDKNITKQAAQRLWPNARPSKSGIAQDDGDAMLIAEHGRRTRLGVG